MIPYREHGAWMIPAASLVLLLPFYLGSVFVEHWFLAKRWDPFGQKPSFATVMIANAVSYVGLGAYYGLQLWWQLSQGIATSAAITHLWPRKSRGGAVSYVGLALQR